MFAAARDVPRRALERCDSFGGSSTVVAFCTTRATRRRAREAAALPSKRLRIARATQSSRRARGQRNYQEGTSLRSGSKAEVLSGAAEAPPREREASVAGAIHGERNRQLGCADADASGRRTTTVDDDDAKRANEGQPHNPSNCHPSSGASSSTRNLAGATSARERARGSARASKPTTNECNGWAARILMRFNASASRSCAYYTCARATTHTHTRASDTLMRMCASSGAVGAVGAVWGPSAPSALVCSLCPQ